MYLVAAVAAAILVGLASVRPVYRIALARGLVSRDVYKGREGVPRIGGVVALASLLAGYTVLFLEDQRAAPLLMSVLAIGAVSIMDDIRSVSAGLRVAASLVPMLVVAAYVGPTLTIPVLGTFSDVVGAAIFLAVPITINAFNMLDVVNGFLPLSNAVMSAALLAVAALQGKADALPPLAVHMAASLALFTVNRYPAKMFNGNVGSHVLGASLAAIAALNDLAFYLVIAAMPYMVNGILIIYSARGIKQRDVLQRPTRILGGRVAQNCDSNVLTLVRVIVSDGPLDEYGIFRALTLLTFISSMAAVMLCVADLYL